MSGIIQSITVQPKPSRQLRFWLVIMHLLALLSTLFAPIALAHKLILLTGLAFYSYFTFMRDRAKAGGQILKATITPHGRARIITGDGRKQSARIRQDSLVTPWLVIVRFDLDQGWFPLSLLLTPDTVDQEQLRQLRVLLRFSQVEKVSDYSY